MSRSQSELETLYFGKNAKITDIQRAYVKLVISDNHLKFGSSANFAKLVNDMTSDAAELEAAIDKVMPDPGSADYNKFLAMKAFTYCKRGYEMLSNGNIHFDWKSLEKSLKLLKPIKLTREAVQTYVRTLQNCACIHLFGPEDHAAKSLKYLKDAEKLFEAFHKNFPDVDQHAMRQFQLFDVTCEDDRTFSAANACTKMLLYDCYTIMEDTEMRLRYVIPCIKWRVSELKRFQKPLYTKIRYIFNEMQLLLFEFHFPQVNHLLAVFMFHCVKERRALPDHEKHNVNNAQADLAHLYAMWAYELVHYSLKWRKNKENHARDYPIPQNVSLMEGFVEEGIETYTNQFPCEPLVKREDYMKVLKKGRNWCLRALDLYSGDSDQVAFAEQLMKGIQLDLIVTPNIPDLP